MILFWSITVISILAIFSFSYAYSKHRLKKKKESPSQSQNKEEWALTRATDQNNQLRIALITISLGIFVNAGNLQRMEIQTLIYIFSTIAAVAGLYAWNSSANYFYNKGKQNKSKSENYNIQMKFGDTVLLLSLLVSGLLTLIASIAF